LDKPAATLSKEERLQVIKDMLDWMSRPGLFRRLFKTNRCVIKLVVDDEDPLRPILETLPTEMAFVGINVEIERDSLQQRKERFNAMMIADLKTGRYRVVIDDKEISTVEEFLAIEDRYERFFAPKSKKLAPSRLLKDTRKD